MNLWEMWSVFHWTVEKFPVQRAAVFKAAHQLAPDTRQLKVRPYGVYSARHVRTCPLQTPIQTPIYAISNPKKTPPAVDQYIYLSIFKQQWLKVSYANISVAIFALRIPLLCVIFATFCHYFVTICQLFSQFSCENKSLNENIIVIDSHWFISTIEFSSIVYISKWIVTVINCILFFTFVCWQLSASRWKKELVWNVRSTLTATAGSPATLGKDTKLVRKARDAEWELSV